MNCHLIYLTKHFFLTLKANCNSKIQEIFLFVCQMPEGELCQLLHKYLRNLFQYIKCSFNNDFLKGDQTKKKKKYHPLAFSWINSKKRNKKKNDILKWKWHDKPQNQCIQHLANEQTKAYHETAMHDLELSYLLMEQAINTFWKTNKIDTENIDNYCYFFDFFFLCN